VVVRFLLPNLGGITGLIEKFTGGPAPNLAQDTTPPPPPDIFPVEEFTKGGSIRLSGGTEAGASVKVNLNGRKREVIANSTGKFAILVNLQKGENKVTFTSTDTAGNESETAGPVRIFLDNEPPELVIEKPQDGENSRDMQISVEGKTEQDARVTINGRVALVENDGSFSLTVNLNEGNNELKITSTDRAGNETELTLGVNYQK